MRFGSVAPGGGSATQVAIPEALSTARDHHRAGRLQQAELAYRQILEQVPNHPDALHLLGMIAYQIGNNALAIDLVRRAVEADPSDPEYHEDLGSVFQRRGDLDAASDCYRKALALNPDSADAHYNLGTVLHAQNKLSDAAASYERALVLKADFADAQINLGTIHEAQGRRDAAIENYRHAISIEPHSAAAHFNLGNVLKDEGRLSEAIAAYDRCLALDPRRAPAYNNRGAVLQRLGDLDAARESYRQAILLQPNYGVAHHNLGVVLHLAGKLHDAVTSYRRALAIKPESAIVNNDLGNALVELGRVDEAIASYVKALASDPGFAEAFNNLGNALNVNGREDEALACYRKAIALTPEYAEAHNNLANTLYALGRIDAALESYRHALELSDAQEFKANFARCLKELDTERDDIDLRRLLIRALSEPWARPAELARASMRLIRSDPAIAEHIEHLAKASDMSAGCPASFDPAAAIAALADNLLLRTLLENARISDFELERCLTAIRRRMLDSAFETASSGGSDDAVLPFYCALSRQCFLNDFVFFAEDDELERLRALKAKLNGAVDSGAQVPAIWVVALAAYLPLSSLQCADALAERSWADAVSALLVQQIDEPMEETRRRADIHALTAIAEGTSSAVRQQYEESPYPKWRKVPENAAPRCVDSYLRQQFPLAPFDAFGKGSDVDILIAGCGTGQESIEMAQRFPRARVLAIDLSLSSLAYASRKAAERGLTNVEHAQADITALSSVERTFDVITSVGVLHHLADPMAGWSQLLSHLRPGGFMHLGFYSEIARRNIASARAFVAEKGFAARPDEIRRCRWDLVSGENGQRFGQLTSLGDFYSTSECRDLLFHAVEHAFTLPGLTDALAELELTFIGFVLDSRVMKLYSAKWPDDTSRTDLRHWCDLEAELPSTFIGMYEFWVQKRARSTR
jgi:tetratricopeptide (TPR) repeat protein/2-polyprenyl-3-methyl-5-hydroxy-6-metoxy-1,4-benzoquinol methylase